MRIVTEFETIYDETLTVRLWPAETVQGLRVELDALDRGGNLKDILLTTAEARRLALALAAAADEAEKRTGPT